VVPKKITSLANPRVKAYAKLKNAGERRRTGLFLIEGYREIERALAAGVEFDTLLVCQEHLTGGHEAVLYATSEVDAIELADTPFSKIALRQHPPGLIAVARVFDTGLEGLRLGPDPLVLIIERVEKPGNLGAMMRTADAAGADAVIMADAATDVFNPNVIRASQGSVFGLPLAVASAEDTIGWAQEASLAVIGGYSDTDTSLWEADMAGPTAILVGAEDVGITDVWSDVTQAVNIPMAGTADSLNASVSAAVLLYEAVRQRRSN
jgi:TrmH family RNA methyltransferase